MRVLAIAGAVLGVLVPSAPAAKLGAHYTVESTGYTLCSAGTTMANGQRVHTGAVANNFLPLGTRIRLDRRIGMHDHRGRYVKRRWFVVADRIGWGTALDIWFAWCPEAIQWGRRVIGFRVVVG